MISNDPIVTSAEAVKVWRQNRYNPIRSATPSTVARALEAFEIGDLRDAALLFESIAERDDTLMSVKPKREKAVSQLDSQVKVIPGSGAMGESHKEVLTDFWGNVTAINAYDRNQKGKFRRLVKQMMTSVSFRYAAHHIVWEVKGGKLRATFEFVPLWLFENRTGCLRYLKNPWAQDGEILADGEWMVTSGDGLMIACSIGWSAKRNAFNDWLIFSAKFSVPGTLGRTSAKKDSPEGRAMHEAVRTFGHDWAGVIYGDDGTHDKPIEIIQASGNPNGMPMPAVVERVDRKFAALYRGADLSTMSAGSGEGSGASLQEKEGDILLSDDAETIGETLEEVSRKVIEWYFGYGVEPLAKLELLVPKREDTKSLVTDAVALADRGAKVSKASLMDRLSLQAATDDADALGAAVAATEPTEPTEQVANAMDNVALSEWLFEIRSALAKDMQPLGDALMGAVQSKDFPAMQAALKKISEKMPDLAGEAENLAQVLVTQFTSSFIGDGAEEVANSGTSDGAVKGWATRKRNGWQARPNASAEELGELVDDALDNMRDPTDRTALFGEVTADEAGLLGLGPGFRHGLSRHGVRHMLKSHGDLVRESSRGQIAITREDIKRIPEIIANSHHAQHAGKNGQGLDTIRYFYDGSDGTTTVLEEVRTGRKTLVAMQMIKFKKQGLRKVPNRPGK